MVGDSKKKGMATELVSMAAHSTSGTSSRSDPDGSAVKPVEFLERIRKDCNMISRLFQTYPKLAEVALQNDLNQLQALLAECHYRFVLRPHFLGEHHSKSLQDFALCFADPLDDEAQRKIKAAICQKGIDENCIAGMGLNPKAFARVVKPFVLMKVRGVYFKVLVDVSAPLTIMSRKCAKKCGLLNLLDRRHICTVDGVDQWKILGRIHSATVKIGYEGFLCSILVMDSPNMEFIFGQDMILKHKCIVSFYKEVFRVGDRAGVPFLRGFETSEEDLALFDEDLAQFDVDLALFDVDKKQTTKIDTKMEDLTIHKEDFVLWRFMGGEMMEVFQVVINFVNGKEHDIYGTISFWDSNDFCHKLYYKDMKECERIKSGHCISLTGPTTYISAFSGVRIDVNLKVKGTDHEINEKFYFNHYDRELYDKVNHENSYERFFSATVSFAVWGFAVVATVKVEVSEGDGNVYGLICAGSDKLEGCLTTTLFKQSRESCIKLPESAEKTIPLTRSVVAVRSDHSLVVYAHLKNVSGHEIAIGKAAFLAEHSGIYQKNIGGIEVSVEFVLQKMWGKKR